MPLLRKRQSLTTIIVVNSLNISLHSLKIMAYGFIEVTKWLIRLVDTHLFVCFYISSLIGRKVVKT